MSICIKTVINNFQEKKKQYIFKKTTVQQNGLKFSSTFNKK